MLAGAAVPEPPPARSRALSPSVGDLAQGVLKHDRAMLGRAITLVESGSPKHRLLARELLSAVAERTKADPVSMRVGITGVPGVGKSTFIESLGMELVEQGHRIAVLAVDPSSSVTGGSILGDKTRMIRLSAHDRAFVRPSPSAGTLGGVASRTRETILLCEAAGYDIVLVETVGVGQSETAVAEMTDCFLALMLPGAGDELQGIKRGLLELADVIAVNKADGETEDAATRAAAEYKGVVRSIASRDDGWEVPVLSCSAVTGVGLREVWNAVAERTTGLRESGELESRRAQQGTRWMRTMLEERIRTLVWEDRRIRSLWERIRARVRAAEMPPSVGVEELEAAIEERWNAHRSH
ncbi:MAG: methylmalonyl Co-A mutase-associated GTPase MeaB [Planctomycetota bacterium]